MQYTQETSLLLEAQKVRQMTKRTGREIDVNRVDEHELSKQKSLNNLHMFRAPFEHQWCVIF